MSKQKRPGFESQQLLSVHFPLRMVVKEIYEVKQCSVLNCAMRSSLLMIDLALKSLPPSKQKKWYWRECFVCNTFSKAQLTSHKMEHNNRHYFQSLFLCSCMWCIAHDWSKEFHCKFNQPVAAKMIQLQNPLLRFLKTTKGNFSGEDF